jgi:hypothetical protein
MGALSTPFNTLRTGRHAAIPRNGTNAQFASKFAPPRFLPWDRSQTGCMSKKEDLYSDDDLHLHAGYIVVIALVLALLILIAYLWRFGGMPISDRTGTWGEFGDYFGGVMNPIIGLATVFLVFITFTLQRRELRASLAEMKRSNVSAATQSFEQSLFSWLANYHSLISAIRSTTGATGRESMQLWYSSQFSSQAVFAHSLGSGMDASDAKSSLAHSVFVNDLPDLAGNDVLDDSHVAELDDYYAAAVVAYDDVYRSQIANLDAALRTAYRLIRWIDRAELADKGKWHYVALVRAQFSWIEMVYMFYNGATVVGEKFVDLANRYALFDNLEPGDDFIVQYAIYKARNDVRKGYKMPYDGAAFNSSLAKERRGLEQDA